jgi:hypothetical protein
MPEDVDLHGTYCATTYVRAYVCPSVLIMQCSFMQFASAFCNDFLHIMELATTERKSRVTKSSIPILDETLSLKCHMLDSEICIDINGHTSAFHEPPNWSNWLPQGRGIIVTFSGQTGQVRTSPTPRYERKGLRIYCLKFSSTAIFYVFTQILSCIGIVWYNISLYLF